MRIDVQPDAVSAASTPLTGVSSSVGVTQLSSASALTSAAGAAGDATLSAAADALSKTLGQQLELAAYVSDRLATRLTTAADHYTATDGRIARAE